MMDIDTVFKRRKINTEKLLSFGFSKGKNHYIYSADLVDGQFEMKIMVTTDGKITTEVIDCASQESYILHQVPDTTGSFVGRVRKEYEQVLVMINEACFETEIFKSYDAKQVIQYVREKYQNELEFLWERFPDNAIFRRQDSAKWYGAILTVQKKKLGLNSEDVIEILDLRMKPEDINLLVDGQKYFPGYHMNKKHWVTICLNGSVPLEEIFCRIDNSFALAGK